MKKIIVFIILAFSLSITAGGASDFAKSRMLYEDTGMFILTHPVENSRVTTSSRMSFLGTADNAYPLYINGEEIGTTALGFFSYYAELMLGENTFVFINGDNIESIVITREAPGQWIPPVTEYFGIELYGSTENNYISRFANLNDDLYGRTPLVRGTTFRILAEHGDFYIIEDGTAVFKHSVFQLEWLIPPITVSGGEVNAGENSVSLSFNVTDNPLYEIILDENKAVLLLYAAHDELDIIIPDGAFITAAEKIPHDSVLCYEFTFEREPVGFIVDFSEGKMNVKFRFAAVSLSDVFVLLDAGHGGHLPGAVGPPGDYGPMEKDLNLYVAEVAQNYLEALGVRTLLIRDRDEDVPILERVAFFDMEPDISVCIHANSMPLSSDFSSERGPLMFITLDLSEEAVDGMIRIIAEETGNEYVPPKRQNFAMARYTGAPSMLFEMGFMCNPEEYEIMITLDYLDKMGEAVGMSVMQYLGLTDNEQLTIDNVQLPMEPEPPVEEEDEEEPPLIQTSGMGDSLVFGRYTILLASVFVAGVALCAPSVLRRKK